MNIFVLDEDPAQAAAYACDRHVIKMVLETAQLLSTVVMHVDPSATGFYKSTHFNHPCSIWSRGYRENMEWLIAHGIALSSEYTKRYGKVHKSQEIIQNSKHYTDYLPKCATGMTPFAQAMPPMFKNCNNAVHAYRMYYAGAKFRFATWKNSVPSWWDGYREHVTKFGYIIENDKNDGVKHE